MGPSPADGLVPKSLQKLDLVAAADERSGGGNPLGRGALVAEQRPSPHRLPLPFGLDRRELLVVECMSGRLVGDMANEDLMRLRGGLEPGRRVRDVAHDRVLGVLRGANESRHHLSRIDSDVQLEGRGNVLGRGDRGLHGESATQRPFGVVLMGDRCPEHRHDRIAHHADQRPAEPRHLISQFAAQVGSQCLDVLGVHLLGHRGEPRDIDEHDGRQSSLLPHSHRSLAHGSEPGSTGAAEERGGGILRAAGWTLPHEVGTA